MLYKCINKFYKFINISNKSIDSNIGYIGDILINIIDILNPVIVCVFR